MRVCGQQFTQTVIDNIQGIVDTNPSISRRKLSEKVCDMLDWRDHRSQPKQMSCRVALLRLHQKGLLSLPPAQPIQSVSKSMCQNHSIQSPDVTGHLRDIGHISLERILPGDRHQSRYWNALMNRYHYLGAGPLCGAQIRYVISSSRYECLGGLAFSSAAWRLQARDRWIGWTDRTRSDRLYKVICNSRFLILPHVKVVNLASKVLSLAVRQIQTDWLHQYGYSPVLIETFVDHQRHAGTCYKAANWTYVGRTKGRGRNSRSHTAGIPVKDVYVYPLHPDMRTELCGQDRCETQDIAANYLDWADEEFYDVSLGDKRLTARVKTIARDLYARPQSNIPQACQSQAKTKAAYRFFDHKDTDLNTLLSSHFQATHKRMVSEKRVFAIQDTTFLNYSAHPATERLGPIGSNQDGAIGLVVHDTMVFNNHGTPLGLIDVQCWARDSKKFGKRHQRYELPIEKKESNKWLISFQKACDVARACPDTTVISISDRESDIYELFQLQASNPDGAALLVRATRVRVLANESCQLWSQLAKEPASGVLEIQVPRQGNKPSRTARLEIRFREAVLRPPVGKKHLGQITLWAVLAEERNPPEQTKAIKWMLLSSVPVTRFYEAVERIDWYSKRWSIEVYHRTLKSGCKIEERQLGHADRIESCLAIDMVVAWRIFHLTKLGREVPDVPCSVYFEESEWKALYTYVYRTALPPAREPTLREAVRMVASLGGFLGRKSDGEPGTKSLWLGLQRLDDLTNMYNVLSSIFIRDGP